MQAPYAWNLRRLKPGFTLDIGCGLGRNLLHLRGEGVGIDHNSKSVGVARSRGLRAFTPEEFHTSIFNKPESFDSILMAHVAEHMYFGEAVTLLKKHLYLLKPSGKLILITPQEAGFKSDSTHTEFMDFAKLSNIAHEIGFTVVKKYSFPLPHIFGRFFYFNEFISVSHKVKTKE